MSVVTLSEDNNGEAVVIHRGDGVDLRLAENASTGFRWHLVRADGLAEEPATTQSPPEPDRTRQVGAGGIRVIRFRAQTPGTGRLELKLWRAFEGDSSILKTFTADITIVD